jgi:general secretion pathway protein A
LNVIDERLDSGVHRSSGTPCRAQDSLHRMYLELFKLKELPFRLTPDPEFLYLSRNHARAKAYMESTIWFTDGFVVITGEIGAGKTTLIETFLREAGNDVVVAQINQTQLSATEFLQAVLVQFGFQPFQMKKVELLATLNNFLVEQHANGRRVLLVVDEAQNLSLKVLEEVRLLSGIETAKDKVIRIILAGQPELNEKLDLPELAQLTQRVRLRFHLTPLSRDDTDAYIKHRIDVAGGDSNEIFAADAYPLIYRYAGGVPRLINTLCDTSMMAAFALEQNVVTAAIVKSAIEELRWSEYAEQSVRLPTLPSRESREQRLSDSSAHTRHERPVARLLLSRKGEALGEFPLHAGRFLVGRTAENDLQIDSKFVSRHHAQIITSRNSCIIEDLNSTNGIAFNGRRVRRRALNDGDVIQVGEHELSYMDDRNLHAGIPHPNDDAVPLLSDTMQLPESMAIPKSDRPHDETIAED